MSPRFTTLIPAMPGFTSSYWNVAIYRPDVTSAAFHEDDDLWLRNEGVDEDVEIPAVGSRLVWCLPTDIKNDMREDVFISRRGELVPPLGTDRLEELVVSERIVEPRQARDGSVYGVLHIFLTASPGANRGGIQ